MGKAIAALLAGLLVLRWLPALPPWWLLAVLALLGLILLMGRGYAIGCLLLGFSWACCSAQQALDDRLSAALDGRTLWLEGQIVGLPAVEGEVQRFELINPKSRRGQLPKRLRLSWYGGPAVHGGERWRVAVQLKRPHGLVNPQAFDYEAWLLAQRIGATGTVKAGARLQAAQGANGWRDQLRERLLAVPASGRSGALAALVLGDSSGLSKADWQVLQHTGTVHLMVISGQHVALLAGLLYGLVAGLARLGWWPARWPWLPWACALSAAGALAYGGLAGFQVPVQRACVMVFLVLLWRLSFRHLGVWLPLGLSMLGVLLWEPLASLQAGFWLSFGAVALLILIFAGRLGAWPWWLSWWRAQWAMTLGLLPLMLALGLPISASAPLANLLAVPLVGLVVVPLALLGTLLLPVPGLGSTLLALAGFALEQLFLGLGWAAAWLPAWLPSSVPVWAWLLLCLGVLVILLPAAVPMRTLGVLLLVPLLWLSPKRPSYGQAEVWLLDVGQGTAVLLRTQEHDLLYDAGPRFGDFDTGAWVVLPSLRALDVRKLDLLLISHADSDHAGGAEAVAKGLPVLQVRSGEPRKLPRTLNAQACVSGQQWQWDGVSFTQWQWAAAGNGNQASCVLRVEANGESLWLAGDIDHAAEQALAASDLPLPAQWLLAPHHGSRGSSSAQLLAHVQPRYGLISRGQHNVYGHPHPQTLARYQQVGAQLYDSAEHGAVRIELGAFKQAQVLRDEPRFWRQK
jgi:competence protein ComEC